MNAFKMGLEIAIAFIIGTAILTLINWKMAQAKLAGANHQSDVQIELNRVNLSI